MSRLAFAIPALGLGVLIAVASAGGVAESAPTFRAVGAAERPIELAATPGSAEASDLVPGAKACSNYADEDIDSVTAAAPAKRPYFANCVPVWAFVDTKFSLSSPHDLSRTSLESYPQVSYYSDLPDRAIREYTAGSSFPTAGSLFGLRQAHDSQGFPLPDYTATWILRITSVTRLDVSRLNAACHPSDNHYDVAYRYIYAPFAQTFQMTDPELGQQYDGRNGTFRVSGSAPSLTVGLTFDESKPAGADGSRAAHLDEHGAQCAVFGGHVDYATDYEHQMAFGRVELAALTAGPQPMQFNIAGSAKLMDLGTIPLSAGLPASTVTIQSAGRAGASQITTTVKAGGVYQRGVVSVNVDGRRIRTEAVLTGGKFRVVLGPSYGPGKHTVTAVFPGGPGALAKTQTATVTITR